MVLNYITEFVLTTTEKDKTKIGPSGPEHIWYFGTKMKFVEITQLSFGNK